MSLLNLVLKMNTMLLNTIINKNTSLYKQQSQKLWTLKQFLHINAISEIGEIILRVTINLVED